MVKLDNKTIILTFKLFCSWIVADSISRVLESSDKDMTSWRKSLLSACEQWLIAAYNNNKEEEINHEAETSMLLRLEELLVRFFFICFTRCKLSSFGL